MTLFYVFLALAVVTALLLLARIGVCVSYRDKLIVDLIILFVRYRVVGREKKPRKKHIKRKKNVKAPKKEKKKVEEKKSDEKKYSTADIIKLLSDVIRPLSERFFHHLRIDKYIINIKVATGDAATTAILYGAASGALHSLTALLKTLKPRKKKGVYTADVVPDFLGETSSVEATIKMSILFWQLLACTIKGGRGFIKYYREKTKAAKEKEITEG